MIGRKLDRMAEIRTVTAGFPLSAGLLLGFGLGGFFDGIVLHQILQWHHVATSPGYPAGSQANLEFNALVDATFHAATWILTMLGLLILWHAAWRSRTLWSAKLLFGSVLMGSGLFNLAEGMVNHVFLGIHHVNETAPREYWIYWDMAFLTLGAVLFLFGWLLWRSVARRVS